MGARATAGSARLLDVTSTFKVSCRTATRLQHHRKPAAQNTATPQWAAALTQASWRHPSVWVPSAKLPTYTELGSDTVSVFPENKKAPSVRGLEPMWPEVAKRRQTAAAQFM